MMDQKALKICVLFLLHLCLVVNSFSKKYRANHQKHHNTVLLAKHFRTDTSALGQHEDNDGDDDGSDGDEIALHNECFYRYAETDHHYAFLRWLHHKNVSHYTPITPAHEKILRIIQPEDIKDGLQISMETHNADEKQQTNCDVRHRKMKPVYPNMPIIDRALCQYEYLLNYKSNRIPATLSEVKCLCTKPFAIGATRIECKPLYYHVRVLLFENDCLSYVEHNEKVAFACIPVFKASIEYEDELIDVPAEEPN